MENYKVIIADDDRFYRIVLAHFLQMLPNIKVVGEVADSDEFILKVVQEQPDFVFIDINMPGVNGVEVVKTCKTLFPELQVIFTTGYEEFAVQAFMMSAADYIVKPIERNRLYFAIEKVLINIKRQQYSPKNKVPKPTGKLIVKQNSSYFFLIMDEILYLEKEGRKTIIHTRNKQFETNESLEEIEERLSSFFHRTHRSYIVNVSHISKIESLGETNLAFFRNSEKTAQISKLKLNQIQEFMNK